MPRSPVSPVKLFYNARIITMDPSQPAAEAIAVSSDRILAVGKAEVLSSITPRDTQRIDLQGQVVVPGFNDSHMHLLHWGLGMMGADLTAARSVDDVIRLGREYARSNPDREWIIGRGWNDETFAVKTLPTKDDLDQISVHRPVIFTRVCGHVCAVNSKALELAGINAATPDPPGGGIDRAADGFEPTGVLREDAITLARRLLPEPTVTDLKEVLSKATRAAAALGLTTVQSADLDGAGTLSMRLDAYHQLAAAGELPIRILLQAVMPTPDDAAAYLDARRCWPNLGPHLSLGPLKLFADGSLGARTAALSQPYADAPDTSGMPIYTQAELDELVRLAAEANLQTAVHAIGDGALEMVLRSYERAKALIPCWTVRPRVIHCQIAGRQQLERMAALGIVADIQPIFVPTDLHFAEERIGKRSAFSIYAWKTMQQLGIRTAGGSDCPVESCNPLWGMHAAITRQDRSGNPPGGWHPDERLTPMEALALFTRGSAYAAQEEAVKGSLTPGKLADFVVLPKDPTKAPPEELLEMQVTATYVGGRQVWPEKKE
ncbi:MAG: amidohydrolase [Firmicutes bacterium]|nr:amidohydrolase [Bacillota bacterium]